jgi:hypothetical protein
MISGMSLKINEDKKQVEFNKPITDCAHLIDLPVVKNVFDHKVKGNDINHPKAGIKILSVFYYKNGLSNLL